ncbi:MAG: AAA family ATPase, partial [Thermoguttaceae bacterium]|nr:AAA family ATPase [Thermoguttaceae bacterium]
MEQIQVVNKDGKYDCDINISTEEWLELLNDSDVTTPITWKTLLGFYQSPNNSAACSAVSPDNPKSPNPVIRHWGERIQEKLKRFQVLPAAGVGYTYWIIPMTGYSKGSNFVWTVRPELVQAIKKVFTIQDKLILDAIEQYKQNLEDNPIYWDGKPGSFGEKYKWEAIEQFNEKWDINDPNFSKMFEDATSETRNLLEVRGSQYKWYPRRACIFFAKYKPDQTRELFQNLFDENIDLKQRIIDFIQKAKELREEIKLQYENDVPDVLLQNFQNTNAISTYLWLKYPKKYYKYAPDIYYCNRERLGLYQYCINKRDGTIDAMLQGFAMYDKIREMLKEDKDLVKKINTRVENLHLKKPFEDDFRTATIDFGYFVSRSNFHSNIQQIQENAIMSTNPYQHIVDLLEYKKNVILQGAPGTGKTYSTAAIALGILGVDVDFNDHKAVMKKYEEFRNKDNRRIFFTTFHQSMDYEDFVEGYKPELVKESGSEEEGNESGQTDASNRSGKIVGVTYNCKSGVFKEACRVARTGNNFSYWLDQFLSEIVGEENKIIISSITGKQEYIFRPNAESETVYVRSVTSSPDKPYATPNIKKIKEQAAGGEPERNWKPYAQAIINHVCEKYGVSIQNEAGNKVVLIIDEINRGNVSKFFGELVTLLEKDKREGEDHPITVTLPYSKEEFSVPSNVYIIGTMNTTDRSTGTLDYAIRRRFAFVTLKAEEEVISNEKARALFNDIKSFIENDKNHPRDMDIDDLMVGHSYFMLDKESPLSPEEQLKLKIQYEVIPLLKEYFNDGLLTCSQDDLDNHIKFWKELKVYGSSETQAPAPTENPADAAPEAATADDEEEIE